MQISAICPVYNGRAHIEKLLQFFLLSKPEDKELLVIDGGSNDGTQEIVKKWSQAHGTIHLLHNPNKFVPYALNMGIKVAKGKYIARLDAHTEYPEDYFENCLAVINETRADNVGGHLISKGKTKIGKAIAHVMSSVFGVGDSLPRVKRYNGYGETVPFGFWKREVFEKFGTFDERLVKNQDEEFNYRIIDQGGKIYQSEKIVTEYFVRDNLAKLASQYYQYGLFKPMVLIKIRSSVRLRHLVPMLFVFYLLSLPVSILFLFWIIPLWLYLILNTFFSVKATGGLLIKLISLVVFPTLHLSYGIGFIIGMVKLIR